LVSELHLDGNFIDLDEWNFLRAGEFPHFGTLRDIYSIRGFVRNVFSGFARPLDAILFAYEVLDLTTTPDVKKSELDLTTISGFLKSKFYNTQGAEIIFQDAALKGISVPGYEVSAMVVKNVLKNWINYPKPLLRIVREDLWTSFIEPIANEVKR